MIVAAVEAGGTKFVLGLIRIPEEGEAPAEALWRESIPTTGPAETLGLARSLLEAAGKRFGQPERMGIGCFGPIELRPGHPRWGRVTTTPKPGWSGADVAGVLGAAFDLKPAFDTDVDAAAAAEHRWGAGRGLGDFIYVTVGTGIGGGIVAGGRIHHGHSHPELGHLRLAREPSDPFPGLCPYHHDCLEGLASGPAMAARWGRRAEELPAGHPAWDLEVTYLARAFAAYACVLAPERILLGGGVGLAPGLAEAVAHRLGEELAGYLGWLGPELPLGDYVKRPALGADAGLFGAAALALHD